jgi:DNA-binding protein HU-beta
MEFQDLVTVLAEQTNYTRREIRQILRELAQIIGQAIEEGRDVHVWGLGKFRNVEAKARSGRHPVTGERIPIPPSRRLKFEPTDELRDRAKASADLFNKETLEVRYGLPKKEKRHGKVRSRNRSQQGAKGKEGGSGG